MDTLKLEAVVREKMGGTISKHYRLDGQLPAILYGNKEDSIALLVDGKSLIKLYHSTPKGKNAIIQLNYTLNGKKVQEDVISYRFEYNPLTNKINHVDFLRVNSSSKLKLKVPIEFQGVAPGVKQGGTLSKEADLLTIKCSAEHIPQSVVVDISTLTIGQTIRARDLPNTDVVSIVSDSFQILARIQGGKGAKTDAEAVPAAGKK